MKRSRGGGAGNPAMGNGGAAAAARALEPAPTAEAAGMASGAQPSEAEGWFSVSRAAQLLGLPLPRIFDAIRDGKLQVRFEPGKPGESDKPQVTSPELKQKALQSQSPAGTAAAIGAAPPSAPAPTPTTSATSTTSPTPSTSSAPAAVAPAAAARAPAPEATPSLEPALADARRTVLRLESEAKETRATLEELEERLDAALKAVYERDVRIARLEAEVAANVKLREGADGFIRHLEHRLDKTEERSEEKEKEIRRLAVGLGEARSEVRLLRPPDAPPPSPWKRRGRDALLLLVAVAIGGAVGYFAYQMSSKELPLQASIAAGSGAVAAWIVATLVERLRKAKA
ncbi:MAG: hypothetical protein JNL90_16915 [Planctomycetes bacterium]|nr:hypothetical protein [Planctomycetota bacterium]